MAESDEHEGLWFDDPPEGHVASGPTRAGCGRWWRAWSASPRWRFRWDWPSRRVDRPPNPRRRRHRTSREESPSSRYSRL